MKEKTLHAAIRRICLVVSMSLLTAGCAQMAAVNIAGAVLQGIAASNQSASSGGKSSPSIATTVNKSLCVKRERTFYLSKDSYCTQSGGIYFARRNDAAIGCMRPDGQIRFTSFDACILAKGTVDNLIQARCSNGLESDVFGCLKAGALPVRVLAGATPSTTAIGTARETTSCELSDGGKVVATTDECKALGGRIR